MKKRVARTSVSKQQAAPLRMNLVHLVRYNSVTVTDAHAKQIKRSFDRLVTTAKKEKLQGIRMLQKKGMPLSTAKQIIAYASGPGSKRSSGYCTLTKVKYRKGDGALITKVSIIQ